MKGMNGIIATIVVASTLGLAGCGEDGSATATQEQTVDASGDLDETAEKLKDWNPSADLGLDGKQGDKED